jgi:excisionase family DNA binding protein
MHDTPTTSKKKPRPRYDRLDGRSPRKPSGRHAGAKPARRKIVTIPVNQRLGFRVREFAALLSVSYPTIWRSIRDKKIPIIEIGGVKLIPRAYAIECGLIKENDNV